MAERVAIILAAGVSKRMNTRLAKVLHEVCGRPMLAYVLNACREAGISKIYVIVGFSSEEVKAQFSGNDDIVWIKQEEQLGTGHAVLCALPHLSDHMEAVVILCGDVPLITTETILKLIDSHVTNRRDITVLAVEMDDPTGYGRILTDPNGQVRGIVEEVDATDEQKKINTINTGIYCINSRILADLLQKISPDNTQGEHYLTDIVALGYNANKSVGVFAGDNPTEFYGINNRQDLSKVQTLMRKRLDE